MKFYNIINKRDFELFTTQEKIKKLIDLDVFSTTDTYDFNKAPNNVNKKDWAIDFSFLNYEVTYLGERYYLSEEFLLEIFEKYISLLTVLFERNLDFLKIFESQLFYFPENELNDLKSKLLREKRTALLDGLFFELNESCGFDDFENHLAVLKKFLPYDLYGIYMYLVGQFDSLYYLDREYVKFINIELKLFCIESFDKKQLKNTKPNIPKKIALLKTLGFFELEPVSQMCDNDKYKIVAFLFDVNFDESHKIDTIRRNYTILKPNSQDNPQKYTSHKYLDTIVSEILNKN